MEPIQFRGRWKEELEAITSEGTLVFEFMMGKEHIYFPDEARWNALAPEWAKGKWAFYCESCERWCKEQHYPFSVVPDAQFYEEKTKS